MVGRKTGSHVTFGAPKEEIEAVLPTAHDAVMLTKERYMELLTAEAQLEALRIKVRKMQHERH